MKTCYSFLPCALAVAVGLSGPAAGAPGDDWQELDRVIAVVNGAPVLLSDLFLESDLGLLEGAGGTRDVESLSRSYLSRRMVLEEIREFGGFSLSPAELAGAVSGYLSRFPGEGEFERRLSRWGIPREEVVRRLGDALTASLYTESRVRFFVQVLPSDVEREYARDPSRWGGKSLEEAWAEIREEVAARAFDREVERWMGHLRERYRVTVFEVTEGGGR